MLFLWILLFLCWVFLNSSALEFSISSPSVKVSNGSSSKSSLFSSFLSHRNTQDPNPQQNRPLQWSNKSGRLIIRYKRIVSWAKFGFQVQSHLLSKVYKPRIFLCSRDLRTIAGFVVFALLALLTYLAAFLQKIRMKFALPWAWPVWLFTWGGSLSLRSLPEFTAVFSENTLSLSSELASPGSGSASLSLDASEFFHMLSSFFFNFFRIFSGRIVQFQKTLKVLRHYNYQNHLFPPSKQTKSVSCKAKKNITGH